MTYGRRAQKAKRFILAVAGLAMVFGYQNCALQATYDSAEASSSAVNKGCDTPIAQAYKKMYYPTLRSKCVSCHDNGEAGPGRAFATADFSSAYDKFAGLTRTKVETMMVNASHKPPFTGPANQVLIDAARPVFAAAEAESAKCSGTYALVATPKAAPATVYSTTPAQAAAWPRLSWDLDSEVADAGLRNVVHATFSIEVRRFMSGTAVIGYEFRNPRMQIKAGSADPGYRIQAIGLNLNGNDLSTFTTYALLNAVVTGNAEVNLGGTGAAISASPTPGGAALATDTFAVRFASVKATNDPASTNVDGGSTGGGTGGDATVRIAYADLISANQQKGIFSGYCQGCHNAGRAAGSLDITKYANANAVKATIQSRMNNVNNPMPPGGLLSVAQRKVVDDWINSGAPEN